MTKMSKSIELTPAQKKAVNLRGHTMLVSAAAGSGKTAVLTRRIIELITDKTNPVDVSQLLVVTFTKAAATELKERISSAIYSALRNEPQNKHLSNQLMLLGKAKICTIHSFCADLVRSNFQLLGLPADLRIADETESALICNNIMENLIDSCYGGLYTKEIDDFLLLSENFLQGKKDDHLSLSFSKIYSILRNYPEGIEILNASADEMVDAQKCDVLDSKWGKIIRNYLVKTFEHYRTVFENACEYFSADEIFAAKYLPAFETDSRLCFVLSQKLKNAGYSEVFDFVSNIERTSLGGVKSELQTDESLYFKSVRDDFGKDLKNIKSKYFSFSEAFVRKQYINSAKISKQLYAFLKIFDADFRKEKTSRGLLDYTDLERYSIDLLYDSEGNVSDVARSIREKYKYVFIDEYQDVNKLQDNIFTAVSTNTNRFMVGDIKQSIYGFRGSMPTLFSEYRTTFPEYNDTLPDSDGVTLYLSDNFRSNKTVIDFSNAVFEILFNNNSGKAPYTKGDRLVCSRIYEQDEKDYPVRLCFVEEDDETKGCVKEAEFVADEVEKLVKSGVSPDNIALLFRSRTNTVFFEDALKKRNIKSFNQVERDFFENDAVLLMLCLLNAIDNPSRDIYLAGVMKSPLFCFDMTELTEIRLFEKSGSLFNALKKYTEHTQSEKCIKFLSRLDYFRHMAEGCPVDRLVRQIYNETHIVELLSGKKEKDSDVERQANLLLLYEYARRFENGSFKGLYNFILYLNDVLEKRTKLSNAHLTSEGNGVVNIMSVHNSKGLEFDTVFICDTAHLFNKTDERSTFIVHKDLGMTLKLRDESSFGRYNTQLRSAAEIILREEALDEELRVLYVALTRAKKRLVITSALKKAKETVNNISSNITQVSHHSLLEAKCMSELILWGILKSDYKEYTLEFADDDKAEAQREENSIEKIFDAELIKEYERDITEKLSFVYPYNELTLLPTKLAVSRLYPEVLDEYTSELSADIPVMYSKPKFLSPERQKALVNEKGTATHLFMQFCDFENAENKGVNAEAERMIEKGFIDRNTASLVDFGKVAGFFESPLFLRVKNARKIWRERRFNIKLPASNFTSDSTLKEKLEDESVLVQGVIDLLFIDESGKTVLVDYKTDYFSDSDIASGKAEKMLKERHTRQLMYYSEACKRLLGKEVDSIMVYSFSLSKTVDIL